MFGNKFKITNLSLSRGDIKKKDIQNSRKRRNLTNLYDIYY